MIARILKWLGIEDEPEAPVVTMPVEKWHALIDERNALRARVRTLEATIAAMEQGQ